MSDEKPKIKLGMKLRVSNKIGMGGATEFFDVESGERIWYSGITYPVKISIDDASSVNLHLTMTRVPVDLVGTVVGMKMNENSYCIEVNPQEFDVVIQEMQSGMKRVHFERRK